MNQDTPNNDGSRAVTDVPEFFTELDAGQFEHMASVALSQVSAAVVDREKKGEVTIKLKIEHIKGTSQVRIEHTLSYARPTMSGKAGEESTGATVMHVGRFGRLSLAQPSLLESDEKRQRGLLDK